MIPKNVIVCWFGQQPLRKEIEEECLNRIKHFFSDYNIIFMNESTFDVNKYDYTKKCYEQKQYAFVSDIARLDALYTYGGIYFDLDVYIVKKFDEDLLKLKAFIGSRYVCSDVKHTDIISAGVIGAEQHSLFIKQVLDDTLSSSKKLPFMSVLNKTILDYDFKRNEVKDLVQPTTRKDLTVFPSDYFCCTFFNSQELYVTDRTYAIHLYAASWFDEKGKQQQLERIQSLLNMSTNKQTICKQCHRIVAHMLIDKGIKKYMPELYDMADKFDGQVPLCKNKEERLKIDYYAYNRTRELIKAIDKKQIEMTTTINLDEKPVIFVFWYQNEQPQIVKKCIESIYKHSNGHKVILITKDNLDKYIDIDKDIQKALDEKRMTITTFSDYVRLSLLSKYNGLWLDATIYVTKDISDEYFNQKFLVPIDDNYTNIYKDSIAALRQRLSIFKYVPIVYILGSNDSYIVKYAKYLFEEYFRNYDYVVDYWLVNDVIDYIIDEDETAKKEFYDCPVNSTHCEDCMISSTYNYKLLTTMQSSTTIFFKMSYKYVQTKLLEIIDAYEKIGYTFRQIYDIIII